MDPVASPAAAGAGSAQLRRLAHKLEASFAAELLRAARPTFKEGLAGRGTGGQAFDSFMDEALGDALVRQGGLGIGDAILREMTSRVAPGAGR